MYAVGRALWWYVISGETFAYKLWQIHSVNIFPVKFCEAYKTLKEEIARYQLFKPATIQHWLKVMGLLEYEMLFSDITPFKTENFVTLYL